MADKVMGRSRAEEHRLRIQHVVRAGARLIGMQLRRHQREALAALEKTWEQGRVRAWVELPPGAGKTLVGLEAARRLMDAGQVDFTVVLSPNTAIQGQWCAQAAAIGIECGADRDLESPLTALTYQSVAVFDADDEVGDDGQARALVEQLHDNGRHLLQRLSAAGRVLLVLDECHHLLEVWGRLLGEVLAGLPEAMVLGLTATPPEAMTSQQGALVEELFGGIAYETSIPALVREGDLAPFAELAWLVEPTSLEQQWLTEGAQRFAELTTALTDPTYGSISLLSWLDARFADHQVPWERLRLTDPELTDAALRFHHAGLLGLPPTARLGEAHRRPPGADDWVRLASDWLVRHVAAESTEANDELLRRVRQTLPAVGYVWTRRGIRAGRSVVDRVLARSQARTTATVQIVAAEYQNLGARMRQLVLTDHERASATLPADLRGVITQESGSAHAVLEALVADPATEHLRPLLVTGRTVAADRTTIDALHARINASDPTLAALLYVEPLPGAQGVLRLTGAWRSRTWVPLVTDFFADGGTQVLIGTRALLGEGWDAPAVTGLVDLTAATTSTAVVQTRGRALRLDPLWPEKVALTWTVVCVAEDHPRGDNDWQRLVRKHTGFYGVDADGQVVDGVAHLDPIFSPYLPPPASEFDAINARMLVRSEDRATIRELWQVGAPAEDRVTHLVRISPTRSLPVTAGDPGPPPVLPLADRLQLRLPGPGFTTLAWGPLLLLSLGLLVVSVLTGQPLAGGVLAGLFALGAGAAWVGARLRHGRRVLALASEAPTIDRVAAAVADGLHETGLLPVDGAGVTLQIGADGIYRAELAGVDEAVSLVYATALEEVLAPLGSPRYVVSRWTVLPGGSAGRSLAASFGRIGADGQVWHAVPAAAASRRELADAYTRGWRRRMGGGPALYTGSPEGAGALAAQGGDDLSRCRRCSVDVGVSLDQDGRPDLTGWERLRHSQPVSSSVFPRQAIQCRWTETAVGRGE